MLCIRGAWEKGNPGVWHLFTMRFLENVFEGIPGFQYSLRMIVGAVNAVVDYVVYCWKVWYVLWQANQRFCPNMTINLIFSVASILSEYPLVFFFFVWWLHQLISNLPFITVEKTHCPHDTWNRCVSIFCISYILALTLFGPAFFGVSGIRRGHIVPPLNIFGLGGVRVPIFFWKWLA